jgi:hypothetical protein
MQTGGKQSSMYGGSQVLSLVSLEARTVHWFKCVYLATPGNGQVEFVYYGAILWNYIEHSPSTASILRFCSIFAPLM